MAGQYSYDPRPFYNSNYGLMPLDEVFYGRSEPVPYWMDQRMAPVSAFDDYYAGQKQMAMGRQLQQQYAYKRPETSRDDIGVDMYRRSPYNFQGVGYGAPPRPMSQDDTWVRSGNHPQLGHGNNNFMMNDQYRHMDQGYMPISHNRGTDHIKTNNMTMGGNQGNHSNHGNQGNYGNQGNSKMSGSSNQFGNNSNGYQNGYENMKSSSQGVKLVKQGSNTKQQQWRRQYDSSSEDSDEEYENGSNNGVKWATKNSQFKHGNMNQNVAHLKSGNSKGSGNNNNNHNNYGSSYNSASSKKSNGGHKSQRSMISRLLGFQDGNSSSSDSDNEGYGHNAKKSSSKTSNYGHQQQQNKPMQYGSSQYKGVELKVPLCCDSCEQKVKECLEYMDGVESVLCDQWSRKVIVYGNVKPENVLKRVRRVKKTAELWQQVKPQQMRAY